MTLPGWSPGWRGGGGAGGRRRGPAGGRRAGLNGGPAGRARPPAGCGLEALPAGGRAAPGRAGLGLGAVGDAVQGPGPSRVQTSRAAAVATSRSAGGGSLLPLAAGPGAPFLRPGRAESGARRPAG